MSHAVATEHAPVFKMGDASNFKPLKAREDQIKTLHSKVDLELSPNPLEHIEKRLREGAASNRNVKMVLEVCVHCSVSLDNCPTYVRIKDIYNSPVGRAELIIAVLKAESLSERIFGKAVGARALDEERL
ncbi:hypothetical protein [Pyrobaculum arsenaticum]|uniref:hypothetical protein n=1 Tax=Pyrobaculum arsenaticum TaxID=121277 RepID=UPI000FFC4680|nr:hypothetical protein [Pyrobaculum arsenaticum]